MTLACGVLAQGRAGHAPADLLGRLARSRMDTTRVGLLLRLSSFYLLKEGEDKTDLDSALLLAGEAKQLSRKLQYHRGAEAADYWIGRTFVEGKRYSRFYAFLPSVSDSNRLGLLNQLIEYKLGTDGGTSKDLDTAEYYSRRLVLEARRAHSPGIAVEAWEKLVMCHYFQNDSAGAKSLSAEGFREFRSLGAPKEQLRMACLLLLQFEPGDTLYQHAMNFRDRLRTEGNFSLRKQDLLDGESAALQTWSSILYGYYNKGEQAISNRGFVRATQLFPELDGRWPAFMLYRLSAFYSESGNYPRALFYALQLAKAAELSGDRSLLRFAYTLIGRTYYAQGKPGLSVGYLEKVYEMELSSGSPMNGMWPREIVRSYLASGQNAEALSFLQKCTQPGIPYSNTGDKNIADAYGSYYYAAGNYDKAEEYYLRALSLSQSLSQTEQFISDIPLARLYVKTQRFDKAGPYLDILQRPENFARHPVRAQQEIAFLAYQVDSAHGDYARALYHLRLSQRMKDSLFNETTNRQFEELKIQYETEKKDKDIQLLNRQSQLQAAQLSQQRTQFQLENEKRLHDLEVYRLQSEKKDNDLKIARFETERKEQNISLLNKQQELQRADLVHARTQKNLFIAGSILLLVWLGLIYGRYRQKQRTNRLLEEKQAEINRSNVELSALNERQQKLITEKEWLVREIHHRVKNNLQIVISLLNEHAEFLSHPSALQAIRESRERMQAIALIHQRLYQSENNAHVEMQTYIDELVAGIADSFDGGGRIRFNLDIAPMSLDIAQAVPIGLILNEAVTNAMKYAGIRNGGGCISIALQSTGRSELRLQIADNGKGLPAGIDIAKTRSLGLQLIQLFSEQLDGELCFVNNGGLNIILDFRSEIFTPRVLMHA